MTPQEIEALGVVIADRLAERLPDNCLLDVHGAAHVLGCSVPTIERLVKAGRIPSVKVGRLRRFKRADLLALNGCCND